MRVRIVLTLTVASMLLLLGAAILAPDQIVPGKGASVVEVVCEALGGLLPFGRTWWGAVMAALGVGGVLAAFPKSVASKSSDDWRPPASWRQSRSRHHEAFTA
jgi:hypothetical protein